MQVFTVCLTRLNKWNVELLFIKKHTSVWKYKSKKYYCWHSFTVVTHLPRLAICSENLPWLFAADICRSYLPWLFAVVMCSENLPWVFVAAICRGNSPPLFAMGICRDFLPWDFCICKQIFFCICEQILFIWKQTFFRCERNFFICEIFFINDVPFCYCRGTYGPL